jgi:lipoprotein-anchoring transpeptidase ErfK/SrfK
MSLALMGALLFNKSYENKFLPNIYIENALASGKEQREIKTSLESKAKELLESKIKINVSGIDLAEISYSDLGVTYNINDIINNAWNIGHDNSLSSNYLAFKTFLLTQYYYLEPSFTETKFDQSITDLANIINKNPKNAELIIENGEIKTIAPENGKVIIKSELHQEIQKAISSRTNQITMQYQEEKAKINETDLTNAKTTAQGWLNQTLTLICEEKTIKTKSTDIGEWIKFSSNESTATAELDSTKIGTYVDSLSKQLNSRAHDKIIDGATGVVVDEGYNGRTIDKESAISKINQAMLNKTDSEITLDTIPVERKEKVVYADYTLGQYPGKYIEIDLANQKLYQIDANTLLGGYVISSGKSSMKTPTGTYSILEKNIKAYSATYGLYMPYWMAFIGSTYGLHALPEWPSGAREGESHLGIPVSHGCVRLSDDGASAIYNWADVGTPVVIH